MSSRLNDLLALSNVPRWSINSVLRHQNVSDHVFRVLVIATELAERLGVRLYADFFFCALHHDAHESWTADLPSPIKSEIERAGFDFNKVVPWAEAYKAPLNPNTQMILKIADKIEAYTFISKFGVGEQAFRISTGCKERVFEIAREAAATLTPTLDWVSVVEVLIEDIRNETGRGWCYESSKEEK